MQQPTEYDTTKQDRPSPWECFTPTALEWYHDQGRNLVKERNDADDFSAFQTARFFAGIRERSRKR